MPELPEVETYLRELEPLLAGRRVVNAQVKWTRTIAAPSAQDFERDSNAVEVLVGRVRRKLGVDLIQTRRGFGYIIENESP